MSPFTKAFLITTLLLALPQIAFSETVPTLIENGKSISTEEVSPEKPKKVKRLKEITIEGEKDNKGELVNRTKIAGEDLSRMNTVMLGDATKVFQTMPGVGSSGSPSDSRMFIQGGTSWEAVASLDDIIIMNPNRWGGSMSMFNPNTISSIDLYTAGYPANFSQGLSGILDVQAKKGSLIENELFFDLGIMAAELGLSGHLGNKFTYALNMRRTYYEYLIPLIMPDQDLTGFRLPYIWDGMAKLGYQLDDRNELELLAYFSQEGMRWNFDRSFGGAPRGMKGNFYYQQNTPIGSLRYIHTFKKDFYSKSTIATTPLFLTNHFEGGSAETESSYWYSSQTYHGNMMFHTLRSDLVMNHFDRHKFSIGGLGGLFVNNAGVKVDYNAFVGTNKISQIWDAKYNGKTTKYLSGYIKDDIRLFGPLILNLGGRLEYFDLNKEFLPLWRCGLKTELSKNLDIYAKAGTFNLFNWDVMWSDDQVGNPQLRSEIATHFMTGVDYEDSAFMARADGFYKFYTNLFAEDKGVDKNGRTNNFLNNGVRNVKGFSLFFQKKRNINNIFNGWTTYTYVDAKQKITERYGDKSLYNGIPKDTWYTPNSIRKHTVSAILDINARTKNSDSRFLRALDNARLSFDFKLMSGQPLSEPESVTRYYAGDGAAPIYNINYGKYNASESELFHKLDVRFTLPFSPFNGLSRFTKNKIKSEFYLGAMNVYNRKNVQSFSYKVVDKTAPEASSQTAERVDLLPTSILVKEEVLDLGITPAMGMKVWMNF